MRAVGHVAREMGRRFGLDARVLRCVSIDRSGEKERRIEAVLAIEVLDHRWAAPPQGSWHGEAAIPQLRLARPEHEAIIGDWWEWQRTPDRLARHHPWVLPGWQAGIVAWAASHLERRGAGPIAAVEQVRSWDLSCVLRVRTPQGRWYLKALPPEYRPEVAITSFLATRFPGMVPHVFATDRERGWLLLEDVGPLMDDSRLDLWERAIDQIATMQRASVADIGALLALGCQDQRSSALAEQAGMLLAEPLIRAALDQDEYAQLRALVPRLKGYCAALGEHGPLPTLVHGDLHTGNIAQDGGRLIFFDWGDACVAHPFLVLVALLDANYLPPDAGQNAQRLRKRYLARWGDECAPELGADSRMVDALAWLRYTLGCLRCFPSLDTVWQQELALSLTSCLRQLLKAG